MDSRFATGEAVPTPNDKEENKPKAEIDPL